MWLIVNSYRIVSWLAATAGRSRGKKTIRGSRQDAVWIEKREVEDKMKYPIEENLPYARLAIIVLAVSAFAIIMLHLQILQEERYLTENYGDSYREYRKRVFRYLGRKLRSREKKEAEEQRMFEMKQQKKREKHKGH